MKSYEGKMLWLQSYQSDFQTSPGLNSASQKTEIDSADYKDQTPLLWKFEGHTKDEDRLTTKEREKLERQKVLAKFKYEMMMNTLKNLMTKIGEIVVIPEPENV